MFAGMYFLGLFIVFTLGLLIAAMILRAAVAWYNKMAGGGTRPAPAAAGFSGYSPNVAGGEVSNPYAAPTAYGTVPAVTVGVPEPGYGRACGIILVSWLANLPLSFITSLIAQGATPQATIAISLMSIPINFLIAAAVLKGMLPTERFGTACLIQLLQLVIGLLVALAIAVVVVVVLFATGVGLSGLGH
jgi:hypothetical protein